jgi:hypothetical protein
LLGSGGRAALTLQQFEPVEFHTFYPDSEEINVNFGIRAVAHASLAPITFRYLHPLALPTVDGLHTSVITSPHLTGESVLRFGCVEGDFVIHARDAIYDPQGSALPFRMNGSSAERLALVLNAFETCFFGKSDNISTAASTLLSSEGADVVVVKCGPAGAIVFSSDLPNPLIVPAFRTDVVNKIGSGDVFSAMFAHYWSTCRLDAFTAANQASLQVAEYVQTRLLPRSVKPPSREEVTGDVSRVHILLAADVDTTPALWLAHEARAALHRLGVAGVLMPQPHERMSLDSMLTTCNAVLALPRTKGGKAALISIAAKDRAKPCIAFSETTDVSEELSSVGAKVIRDFAASIYAVVWSAL